MDGTFKTVPIIFKQLYTIYRCVRGNGNSRIMPLVIIVFTMVIVRETYALHLLEWLQR